MEEFLSLMREFEAILQICDNVEAGISLEDSRNLELIEKLEELQGE